ncbi:MAG: hypothetical protein HQK49_01650 [Oligoflexia bacterium]|nr:hypothetical protein [Oligoflexia bacterium]
MGTDTDIIVGIHSIVEALKNPQRKKSKIFATDKGMLALREASKQLKLSTSYESSEMSLQDLNKHYEKKIKEHDWKNTSAIPSQIFLETSSLKIYDSSSMLDDIKRILSERPDSNLKLFALDNVTDVHNGAAILRTAAFFGVDFLIMSLKGSFGLTPSFYRIASGATEYVKIVKSVNLSRLLFELQEREIECIGFSEHATDVTDVDSQNADSVDKNAEKKFGRCLVLGSEDKGLSHAVERVLKKKVAIISSGKIKTLNVSVAAALSMDRYF